jgi:hypothetical protein
LGGSEHDEGQRCPILVCLVIHRQMSAAAISTAELAPLTNLGVWLINTFCGRLGLPELPETFLAHNDSRLKLAPAAGIGVVVRNLVLGREPVYALGEWAAPFDPGLLGLAAGEARLLNDDRVGRGWRGCSTPTGPRC